ncbi:ABC transporter permease [Aestuariivirga sp. YIM B02566]|uniref:ABC transporter permease n=2 Tax=Taklimakanibacter albus TaxID=2800327 RepID=A0ACC5REY2_9HYPH|nr:ABC transporter permease [Aestuariivirga sp. YIM B02566]MBK1871259.1 ABC transporter permease [Aestuariivirga sp. YIM B02566]
MGLLGIGLVLLIVLGALFAGFTGYSPSKLAMRDRFHDPSFAHLLGTDHLGRDLFTRVLHGARIALGVAFVATGISFIGGLILGMIAGYGPRWLDSLLLLLFDSLRAFPTVMLALALVTLTGPSLAAVVLVVVLATLPGYARVVRAQTMSLKTTEFVLSARSLGAPSWRILAVHIMPNLIGPLVILVSMDIPVVITIEAGMSFLGLGVRPPTPSWGAILNDGYAFIRESAWPAIAGGLPIIIATLGFTFLGETLRDHLDPRLRQDG